MIQNYLTIALRNLRKTPVFTAINVFGLALGMSACLSVILIIRDQLGYEKFHPATGRTYRILSQAYTLDEGGRGKFATSPYPLGETLRREFSGVENAVRLVRGLNDQDATTSANLTFQLDGYFTEPSFFQVFGFQLESGDPATALTEPNSIVLNKQVAARFFGNQDPMGQMLTLKNWGVFRVTGIALPPLGKSHIGFDCLVSVSTIIAKEHTYTPDEAVNNIIDNWENRYMSLNYVVLQPEKQKPDLEYALSVVSEKYTKPDEKGEKLHLFAQRLDNITPMPEMLHNEIGFGVPWFFIWGLGAFVALLIIFPGINYANLAIARAWARSKEVGVRKVMGAGERDVTRLFLVEAVLTALLALCLAWLLHHGINHYIKTQILSELKMRGSAPISFHADAISWVVFILFGVTVGLFAGWLPARRMAKTRPATVIRGELSDQKGGTPRFGWSKLMATGQFTVSLIFMIVVATLWSQLRFLAVVDYGFEKENLVTFELKGNDSATLAAEIAQNHQVSGVTTASILIAGNSLQGGEIQVVRSGDKIPIHQISADLNYIPVMGLQLAAGENFPSDANPKREQYILLNEKAVKHLGLGDPNQAIGQTLWLSDSLPVTVQGVLRDFYYRPLKDQIQPFALRFVPQQSNIMHVRLHPGDPGTALAALESIWKKVDGIHPFEPDFMEEKMRNAYRDIELLSGLLGFFALLGLSLACLGLLGMVTYVTSMKVKEIGIRKVLGANIMEVMLLLSRHFLLLLAIAVVIALPLGYLLSNQILSLFAVRITVGGLILGGCTAVLLLLGLLTIGVQSLKAALANPVKSLRNE